MKKMSYSGGYGSHSGSSKRPGSNPMVGSKNAAGQARPMKSAKQMGYEMPPANSHSSLNKAL